MCGNSAFFFVRCSFLLYLSFEKPGKEFVERQTKIFKGSPCAQRQCIVRNPLRGAKLLMRQWRKKVNVNLMSFVALCVIKEKDLNSHCSFYFRKLCIIILMKKEPHSEQKTRDRAELSPIHLVKGNISWPLWFHPPRLGAHLV